MSSSNQEKWREAFLQAVMRAHDLVDHRKPLTLFERVTEITDRMDVDQRADFKARLLAANRGAD